VRLTPAVAGMAGILASAVVADVWAAQTGRPTISAFVAEMVEHPIAGPVTVGVLTALGWHLIADPVLIRRMEVVLRGSNR
jgi:hypothetical protein